MTTLRIVENNQVIRITGLATTVTPDPLTANAWTPSSGVGTLTGDLVITGLLIGGSSPFRIESKQSTLSGAAFQLAAQLNITGQLLELINDGTAAPVTVWSVDGQGITYLGNLDDAAEPAAGTPGRMYWNTDQVKLRVDNGTNWVDVDGGGGISDPITVDGWTPSSGIGTFTGVFQYPEQAEPALSPAGSARVYFDSTSKTLQLSEDGSAYAPIGGGGISDPITVNGWTPASGTATITGNIVGTAFTDVGGIAAPALSPAGKARLYFDSTSNTLKLSEDGGAFADIGGDFLPLAGGTLTGDLFMDAGADIRSALGDARVEMRAGAIDSGMDLTSDANDSATARGFRFHADNLDKDTFTAGALHTAWTDSAGDRIFALGPDGQLIGGNPTGAAAIQPMRFLSRAPSGKGFIFDTEAAVGSNLAEFQKQGVALFRINTNGGIQMGSNAVFLSADAGGIMNLTAGASGKYLFRGVSGRVFMAASAGSWEFDSRETDSASAQGFIFLTANLDKDSFTAGALHTDWLDAGADSIMTLTPAGDLMILGDLDHDGSNVGFYGTAPAPQSAAYTRNAAVVEDRTLLASASATTINNNNVLAALIADLKAVGLLA